MPPALPGPHNSPGLLSRLTLWQRAGLILATLATAVVTATFSDHHAAGAPDAIARRMSHSIAAEEPAPVFTESWITPPGHTPSAHSSSTCLLPSGTMLTAWFGGIREGASDVALYTARRHAGSAAWSKPEKAVDREMAQDELDRVIKKIGNVVIFTDRLGGVWMVYVTVTAGGWSGSALNIKHSADEGRTWGPSQRLTLNPFFNLSTLVRNGPIYARDGRIGLPVYFEMTTKFPQILWLTPGPGGTLRDYRMRNLASETDLIQPTLIPLGEDRVLMLLRDGSMLHRMHTAYSTDNGWTWSGAQATPIPNSDSAIDGLRLRDGRILVVYNHADERRENLRVAISNDEGRTWEPGIVLEQQTDGEFSYPCLMEDERGRIHLTYTWQRRRIKHLEFNVAWLNHRSMAQADSRL